MKYLALLAVGVSSWFTSLFHHPIQQPVQVIEVATTTEATTEVTTEATSTAVTTIKPQVSKPVVQAAPVVTVPATIIPPATTTLTPSEQFAAEKAAIQVQEAKNDAEAKAIAAQNVAEHEADAETAALSAAQASTTIANAKYAACKQDETNIPKEVLDIRAGYLASSSAMATLAIPLDIEQGRVQKLLDQSNLQISQLQIQYQEDQLACP